MADVQRQRSDLLLLLGHREILQQAYAKAATAPRAATGSGTAAA